MTKTRKVSGAHMSAVSVSFAACGFMGVYHLGAVGAFLTHSPRLEASAGPCPTACAGASAGALVAALLITAPEKLQECTDFTYSLARSVRKQPLGAVTPGFNFMEELREGIESMLPADAHTRASHRLFVSLTHAKTGLNRIMSTYQSRDELVQVLLASSFVPVYAGLKPVEFGGELWVDGGLSDSLPLVPFGRTVTVSPFSGPQDICPTHRGRYNTHLHLANMKIMFSGENLRRLNRALFPPPQTQMEKIYSEGFSDAQRFMKSRAWTCSDRV